MELSQTNLIRKRHLWVIFTPTVGRPVTYYPASQSAQSFKRAYKNPEFPRKMSVVHWMSNMQRVILDWETK